MTSRIIFASVLCLASSFALADNPADAPLMADNPASAVVQQAGVQKKETSRAHKYAHKNDACVTKAAQAATKPAEPKSQQSASAQTDASSL